MLNITTNHAITYTNDNNNNNNNNNKSQAFIEHIPLPKLPLSDPLTPNIGPCTRLSCLSRGFSSSETQGQIVGAREFIGARKTQVSGTTQKSERRQPFGTGLVRHCPQGLFSPFFTFLCAIFFRPFRLSPAPTICPWVSEDGGF